MMEFVNEQRSKAILEHARHLRDQADQKVARLRQLEPLLLDISLREASVGSRAGQTLAEKLKILPRLRAFGFTDIILGTLNYPSPDELEVDDDFMMYLRDQQADLTGCFALTSVGTVNSSGEFSPDPSLLKLKAYNVPNTVLEIHLSQAGMPPLYDLEALSRSLPASIRWLHDNLRGGRPRIIVNIVDGCDAFADNLEVVCSMLDLLANQPIEGVSFQDERGTFLPVQVGSYTAIARSILPPSLKLLVHVHGGAGFENASVMEALLNGADGAWGALARCGPVIGHACLGELIANLVRVGNPHMQRYQVQQLLPLVAELWGSRELHAATRLSMLGDEAHRLPLEVFRQEPGRFMDLPPESLGGTYRYRVTPVATDRPALGNRLAEVTGRPIADFPGRVLDEMMRLMRRDQREGKRLIYDDAENLLALYVRASG